VRMIQHLFFLSKQSPLRARTCLLAGLMALLLASGAARAEPTTVLTISGPPLYRWNGEHFSHADPAAPKGGSLRLAANGNFDSMHPYIPRGIAATGIGLTVDTLGVSAPDYGTFEYYGLVAESFDVAADGSSVTFNLNPKARFHDGAPITAADVAATFELLTTQGSPSYRQYYAGVAGVKAVGQRAVRFDFKPGDNAELPLILAQLPVLPARYWAEHDFSQPTLTPPLGNGPYRVKDFAPGQFVEYERVPDYWAADLPVNKGRYNFDTIRYEYYRDQTVAREAFKAGDLDLFTETTAKAWATAYDGPALAAGDIRREEIAGNKPQGMYGFVFNTRRPVFADRDVRRALALAFDFEWTNKALFHGAYTRCDSFFSNSAFASSGLPGPGERALLEPFAEALAPEVLTRAFEVPATRGDGNIRPQLAEALKILNQAGWTLKDGRMTDAQGRPLAFTLLLSSASLNRVVLPLKNNLAKLGVAMDIALADSTQYVNRMRAFDYDMIIRKIPQSSSPGNEQRSFWTAAAADLPGSRNYAGVKDPVVDALVDAIIAAPDRAELITRCRALDRVLLWGAYVIPGWYSSTTRVAYWDRFARSAVLPATGLDIHSWWVDPAADARLRQSGSGYGD